MSSMKMVYGAAYLFALGMLLAANARAEADKITLVKNKEVIVGKITKDDRDGLEMEFRDRAGVAKRTFNSSDVADVEFDVSEDGYHEGGTEFRKGSYDRAAEYFGSIATQAESLGRVRAIARPYILYMYAESLYRAGNLQQALAAFQKLIDSSKTSRYVPFALANMADAAIQSKAYEKVQPLLNQLREGGPEQKQLADYYEGESFLAQGKAKDAVTKYTNAGGGASGTMKAMALLGQARATAATGDLGRARELAQQSLALNPADKLAAKAHSIIGDAIVSDVDAKKLAGTQLQDALLDAILEYMRVKNQYATDTATEGYALLKIGEAFKRLSKLPAREQFDDRGRARAEFEKLSNDRRFAGSELANKAFKHLEEMK